MAETRRTRDTLYASWQDRDLHRVGSYVTGYLTHAHSLVQTGIMDDRTLDGIWLGNDFITITFFLYSSTIRKVVRLSDPCHFDHIMQFLNPYAISLHFDLSREDICPNTLHAASPKYTLGLGGGLIKSEPNPTLSSSSLGENVLKKSHGCYSLYLRRA